MGEILIEVLLFCALAIIVFFRLFSVFGSYDFLHHKKKQNFNEEKEIEIIDLEKDLKDCPLPDLLQEIKKHDPFFSYKQMVKDVQELFLAVIKAFYKHDNETLKKLLNQRMYDLFVNNLPEKGLEEPQISFFIETLWMKGFIDKEVLFCDFKIVSERRNVENNRTLLEDVVDFWTVSINLKKKSGWVLCKTGK